MADILFIISQTYFICILQLEFFTYFCVKLVTTNSTCNKQQSVNDNSKSKYKKEVGESFVVGSEQVIRSCDNADCLQDSRLRQILSYNRITRATHDSQLMTVSMIRRKCKYRLLPRQRGVNCSSDHAIPQAVSGIADYV